MSVENISLATKYEGYSSEGKNGIRFHQYYDSQGSGDRDVRLVFSTMYGTDVQASFLVRVTYSGYRKGGIVQTSPAVASATIAASNANCVQSGGRYWWSIPLTSISPSLTGGTWTYASRTWDGLTMDFSITCRSRMWG